MRLNYRDTEVRVKCQDRLIPLFILDLGMSKLIWIADIGFQYTHLIGFTFLQNPY